MRHLDSHGLCCVYQGDIATGQDALALDQYADADNVITNPPYQRRAMHALLWHFMRILPTWVLLYMDWASTWAAAPFSSNGAPTSYPWAASVGSKGPR